MQNKLIEETKVYYKGLYESVKKFNGKKKLTICPAIHGGDYFNSDSCTKIMFVGRAINGWCETCERDFETFIKFIGHCNGNCSLDWVVGENYWSNCNKCPIAENNNRDANAESAKKFVFKSHFWQLIKYICIKENDLTENDWYKRIVWTNLHKASYSTGGNPPSSFYRKPSVEYCDNILKKEIEYYKPDKIYFITEKRGKLSDRAFSCTSPNNDVWFDKESQFPETYEFLCKSGIEVFILERPEQQKRSDVCDGKRNLKTIIAAACETKKSL